MEAVLTRAAAALGDAARFRLLRPVERRRAGTAAVEPVAVAAPATRTTVTGVQAPKADEQTIRPDAKLLFVAGAGWTKKQADGAVHAAEAEKLILGVLRGAQASLPRAHGNRIDAGSRGQRRGRLGDPISCAVFRIHRERYFFACACPDLSSPTMDARLPSKWQRLVASGRNSEAVDEAQAEGLSAVCNRADVASLIGLGDAARFAGRRDTAAIILRRLRERFPDDERASIAAFDLAESRSTPRRTTRRCAGSARTCANGRRARLA